MDSSTIFREALPGIEQIRAEFPLQGSERAWVPLQFEYGAMVVDYSMDTAERGNELITLTLALLGPVGVWRGSVSWQFHASEHLEDEQEKFKLEDFGRYVCRPRDDLTGPRLPILGRIVGARVKQRASHEIYLHSLMRFRNLPQLVRRDAIAACGPTSPLYRPMAVEAARLAAEDAGTMTSPARS